jgi:hypothetical protein
MKVNVYIDGFNLYYGAVKGTPYRWLNLAEMCRLTTSARPDPTDQVLTCKSRTSMIVVAHHYENWNNSFLQVVFTSEP